MLKRSNWLLRRCKILKSLITFNSRYSESDKQRKSKKNSTLERWSELCPAGGKRWENIYESSLSSFFFTLQVKENNRSSENLLEFYSATKVVAERSMSIGLARPETCLNWKTYPPIMLNYLYVKTLSTVIIDKFARRTWFRCQTWSMFHCTQPPRVNSKIFLEN